MTLSDRIKSLREKQGWTQNKLAMKAHVPQPTIWRLEKGLIRNPKMELLRKLADALDVSVDELAWGIEHQLSLFEKLFPGDELAPAVFRGYEKLPAHRKKELLNFLQFIEKQEAELEAERRKEQ